MFVRTLLFLSISYSLSNILIAQDNVASLNYGSKILSEPESYAVTTERNLWPNYSAGALIDDTENPWCSKNTKFPFEFIIELTEEFDINKLEFNNISENDKGTQTKNIKVEFSKTSATSGYQLAGTYVLKANEIQQFELKKQVGRWIKITISSNYGHAEFVELTEFKAFGTPVYPIEKTIAIHGDWETNWNTINFKQNDNSFTGTYAYGNIDGTVYNGTIFRNRLTFDWIEGPLSGYATLYLNSEGDQLSGRWQNKDKEYDKGLWTMTRKFPVSIEFEQKKDTTSHSKTTDTIQTENTEPDKFIFKGEEKVVGEKVVLKQVLFKQSSAILLPSSHKELSYLITLLNSNPNLTIELKGYTDNQGKEELNLKLSQDRVTTVTNYLINKGINYKRITGKGMGSQNPITDNSTEELRKTNRRVEFVLR